MYISDSDAEALNRNITALHELWQRVYPGLQANSDLIDRALALVRAGKITPTEYAKNKSRPHSLADLVRIRSIEPIRPLEIAGR